MLRTLAWNDMHPRPGELAAAAFAPLAVVNYPDVDADNAYVGLKFTIVLQSDKEKARDFNKDD